MCALCVNIFVRDGGLQTRFFQSCASFDRYILVLPIDLVNDIARESGELISIRVAISIAG